MNSPVAVKDPQVCVWLCLAGVPCALHERRLLLTKHLSGYSCPGLKGVMPVSCRLHRKQHLAMIESNKSLENRLLKTLASHAAFQLRSRNIDINSQHTCSPSQAHEQQFSVFEPIGTYCSAASYCSASTRLAAFHEAGQQFSGASNHLQGGAVALNSGLNVRGAAQLLTQSSRSQHMTAMFVCACLLPCNNRTRLPPCTHHW
jgi:hypothetical protein